MIDPNHKLIKANKPGARVTRTAPQEVISSYAFEDHDGTRYAAFAYSTEIGLKAIALTEETLVELLALARTDAEPTVLKQ